MNAPETTPARPAEVVISGSVVVTLRGGKCAGCGTHRMVFINKGGRTVCAGCSGTEETP